MGKMLVCISVFLFMATGFAQTDTKPVTPSTEKQVSSKDVKKQTSSQAKPSSRSRMKKPTEPPSPYVDGRVHMEEHEFMFGFTPTNCTIFHSFYIKNVGTDTLDIVKVKPG